MHLTQMQLPYVYWRFEVIATGVNIKRMTLKFYVSANEDLAKNVAQVIFM